MSELGERQDPDIQRIHRADRPLAEAIRMGQGEPDEPIMDDEVAGVSLLGLSIRRGLHAQTVMQSSMRTRSAPGQEHWAGAAKILGGQTPLASHL